MNDFLIVILFLLIVTVLIWVLILSPKAEEARAERQRRSAAEKALRESRRAELRKERDEKLAMICGEPPQFILKAQLEFEREYKAQNGGNIFGQEMSPLVCFGYRVGKTNGRVESERHTILEYALGADLDATLPFLPSNYRDEWGSPLSVTRFNRIYQHLNSMADLREGRRNFEIAVSHWRSDASWFVSQQRSIVEKYREI